MKLKVLTNQRRFLCTATIFRPYSEVPGPPALPLSGHSHLFSPFGPYKKDRLTEAALDLSSKYGPVFRLSFPGKNFIITTNPDDARILFHHYTKYPRRDTLDALVYYRKQVYGALGVVPGNGEEWYKFRTFLGPLSDKIYMRKYYLAEERDIAITFVNYIKSNRNSEGVLHDIMPHLMKYAIESISVISPGVRVRCLGGNDEFAKEVIRANSLFMDGLFRTFSEPHIWKYVKTKGYNRMEEGHNIINRWISNELEKLSHNPVDEKTKNKEKPFIESLFRYNNFSRTDASLLATEVFFGGIDTTATTIAMMLYYLSKNPECQELAYKDALLGCDEHQIYLRACIKETLRLSSTAGGISRILPKNVLLSGYFIPANTAITLFTSATGLMEKYYKNADQFKPERWIKEHEFKMLLHNHHPFASLPFGHGARACPGRVLAEQKILLLLTEILKEFSLDCEVNNVGMVYRMNRMPDKDINIKFIDRNFNKG